MLVRDREILAEIHEDVCGLHAVTIAFSLIKEGEHR